MTTASETRLGQLAATVKRDRASLDGKITRATAAVIKARQPFEAELSRLRTELANAQAAQREAAAAAQEKLDELNALKRSNTVAWGKIAAGIDALQTSGLSVMEETTKGYDKHMRRRAWRALRDTVAKRGQASLPHELRVRLAGVTDPGHETGRFTCSIKASQLGDLAIGSGATAEQAIATAAENAEAIFWDRYELGH